MTSIKDFREDLARETEAWGDTQKPVSVLLLGSLARLAPHLKDGIPDVDIMVIDRGYSLAKARSLQTRLSARWPQLAFDVGTYPADRLRSERSLLVYDMYHTGFSLYGAKPHDIVPVFDAAALFPYEGFRLLFNRTAGLLDAWNIFEEGAKASPGTDRERTAARRALAAARDASLIFQRRLVPDPEQREIIAPTPQLATIQASDLLARLREAFSLGENEAGKIEKVVVAWAQDHAYPASLRLAAAARLRDPRAAFANPFFDGMVQSRRIVERGRATPQERASVLRIARGAAQPLLRRAIA